MILNENKLQAIATTGRKWSSAAERLAREVAARLGIPYVERGRQTLPELRAEYAVDYVLVAKQGQLKISMEGASFSSIPIWPICG